MTALGVAAGQAVWALATAIGVVAFLVTSEPVFAAVKLAGACYIVFLGARSVYAALRSAHLDTEMTGDANPRGLSAPVALRQGVVGNLGNPKMAVFFASLLPQFARQGEAALRRLDPTRLAVPHHDLRLVDGLCPAGRGRRRLSPPAQNPPGPGGRDRHGLDRPGTPHRDRSRLGGFGSLRAHQIGRPCTLDPAK